ncbi:hypothetical protein T484DRAFT_3297583 [Baffinella frigidus]|nr:hypothetical protein T484DRAFT_3297583 [Cryptophyta sp. CCMP2293]
MCSGWFVDPRTQHYYGPVEDAEEKYYSIGRQATFFTIGTEDAVHGNCDCHYGYRSSPDVENCNLQCPGTPLKYLDELGECFDNGNCTEVGICDCKDGFRNESCDVRCKGGHLDDILTGFAYSNECTSNFICDVYPNYLIQSITGPAPSTLRLKPLNPNP